MSRDQQSNAAQARRVLISVNPKAGRSSPLRRAEQLCRELGERGFDTELLTDLDEVAAKANTAYEERELRAVVGVGGDGTAAELVNRTRQGVPVTLLASGTANLLAKQFRLPFNPKQMADIIEHGKRVTFDAGLANGRLFLAMISAGVDADIVKQVHGAREKNYIRNAKRGAHISFFSYVKPILRTVFHYHYPIMSVHIESSDANSLNANGRDVNDSNAGESQDLFGRWVFIFNFPRYGWGVKFTPNCYGGDGKLNDCIFKNGGFFRSIFHAALAQLGGQHRHLANTHLGYGTKYHLSAQVKVPYQLDGDPGGVLPVTIQIVPDRFTTLLSSEMVQKLKPAANSGKITFHK